MKLWQIYPRYGTAVDISLDMELWLINPRYWNCGRYILDVELWQIYPRYGTLLDESQIWNCVR